MKTKNILYLLVGILLLSVFFFKIIPIPLENIQGLENPDEFIYGGVYLTSGLYELGVQNYIGVFSLFTIFIVIAGGIYLIK